MRTAFFCAALCVVALVSPASADWPQWRGPNRDAKAADFKAPATWPKELTQKWKVPVGNGVATPALVGERLFVFTREGDEEVIRCLDAASGKELWKDKYATKAVTGPAGSYPGPRASPTVADGKVVTLGVGTILSCLDAATGKVLWRKEEFGGAVPRFFPASSPIVIDGVCIAQLGGSGSGGIIAYDLATGNEKWKWTGDAPAYGSPVLMTVGGTKAIIAPTERNLVALNVADGKELWRVGYEQGRYNAATPIVDGQTLIYAGPTQGMTAEKLDKPGNEIAAKELWKNADNSLIYNTPVLKDGLLYGVSTTNVLFCVDAAGGKTMWSAPLGTSMANPPAAQPQPAAAQPPGKGGKGKGGRGGGGGGYGSVVDAGSVLLALTPLSQLVVFEPNGKEFKQLASYKVSDQVNQQGTHAYPIVSGNRVFIKDHDSVALFTIE